MKELSINPKVSLYKSIVFIALMIFLMFPQKAFCGNGPDPVRAMWFAIYKNQAKKALKAQDELLGMSLTEHIYHKQQVDKIANFHKEFNKYLESFGDVLTLSAEIYGIYYEVDQAIKNVKELKNIVSSSPANVVAVALSERKNNVYQDVIEDGIQFAADLAQILPLKADNSKNSKMTEADRYAVVRNIRTRLRSMNMKIRAMNRLLYSTTLMDSWYELTGRQTNTRSMKEIVTSCHKQWINRVRNVRY